MNTRNALLALAGMASVLFASANASASGFDLARFGSDRANAASPTAFSTYYNPAALASTRKYELAGDLMLAIHTASYDRTATTVAEPEGAAGANIGQAKLRDVLAGPALAASLHLGDFAAGIGVFSPMSGFARWKGNDSFKGNTSFPGAQDGTARWHLIEGDTQVIYFSAAAAYNIEKIGLSFGVGANLIYNRVNATRAVTLSLDDNLSNEGRIHVDVNGLVGSFSAGALWEIMKDKLWLGLSYQAPPGLYNGMVLQGEVRQQGAAGQPTKTKADLHQTLPDIIRFALRFKQEKYELRLIGDFARWSVFKNQCVAKHGAPCEVSKDGSATDEVRKGLISAYPRNWKNALGLRVGGSYWFTPAWEGFAALGWDGNAIPAGMLEPTFIDGNDLSAQLGARYNFGTRVALSLAYTGIYWLPRDTTGKSKLDKLMSPGNLPTSDGKYNQFIGLFNTFVEVYFD
jgi:long-chain fatty acid transport protein